MAKKMHFLFVLVIFLLTSVYARPDTPFEPEATSAINPPPPPEDEAGVLKILDVILELRDYETKSLIKDIHVNLEILDKKSGHRTNTLKYVGNDGLVKLRLDRGGYDVALKVDRIETKGRDYFIRFDQDVMSNINRSVYLFSVGSVIGNVYDQEGSAVDGAQIKFDCSGDYGEIENKISDRFGSFSSYWLPIGPCRISSMHGSKVGYKDLEIKTGELTSTDIELNKGIASEYNLIAAITLSIAFVALIIVILKKKRRGNEEPKRQQEGSAELSPRTKDIMKTLKDKERSIVNFLVENNNKSTQAKIRYGTGIPKTSLARVLLSLELKKILKIESVGKLKKVELTAWFLGKE